MKNKILALSVMAGIFTANPIFASDLNDGRLDPKERALRIHTLRTELGDLYQQWQSDPKQEHVHKMYNSEWSYWRLLISHAKEDRIAAQALKSYKELEMDDLATGISYYSALFKRDIAAGDLLTSYNPAVDNKPLVKYNYMKNSTISFLPNGRVEYGKYISHKKG